MTGVPAGARRAASSVRAGFVTAGFVTAGFVTASVLWATGCAAPSRPAEDAPTSVTWAPSDYVAAAGLRWLVELEPRPFLATPELAAGLAEVGWEARARAFAQAHAGIEPQAMQSIAVAGYEEAELWVAAGPVDPRRVEAAFQRTATVQGREVHEWMGPVGPSVALVRTWGASRSGPEQLLILGPFGAALEIGPGKRLRAAEGFARGLLKRSAPALRAEPLTRAALRIARYPLRAYAPGPFEGVWAHGFRGLLGAASVLALGAAPDARGHGALEVRVLVEAAGDDEAAALAGSLEKLYGALARGPLGHLLGLDEPLGAPSSRSDGKMAELSVVVDGTRLLRGVHLAVEADVPEIMAAAETRKVRR